MGIAIAIHDLIARDTWVGYLSRIVIRHGKWDEFCAITVMKYY